MRQDPLTSNTLRGDGLDACPQRLADGTLPDTIKFCETLTSPNVVAVVLALKDTSACESGCHERRRITCGVQSHATFHTESTTRSAPSCDSSAHFSLPRATATTFAPSSFPICNAVEGTLSGLYEAVVQVRHACKEAKHTLSSRLSVAQQV